MNPYFLEDLIDLSQMMREKFPQFTQVKIKLIDSFTFDEFSSTDGVLLPTGVVTQNKIIERNNVILMIIRVGVAVDKATFLYLLSPRRRNVQYMYSLNPNDTSSLISLLVKEKIVSRAFQSALLKERKEQIKEQEDEQKQVELFSTLSRLKLKPSAEQKRLLRRNDAYSEAMIEGLGK